MSTADSAGDGGNGEETMDRHAIPSTQPQPSSQQHPPPSPLSGGYLIVVLPEPRTARDKDLILNRLAKGFLSWDKDACHVDLEKELQAFVAQAPEGEEARNGERLIQFATENLVTEVLIHPQTNTLLQCIRNLLASFTKHRHIIHAGYTFGGNGSWILQDGTFSLTDFLDTFSEHDVQRVLRAYENSVTVDIHCAGAGDWSTSRLSKESCTSKSNRVRVNPDDVLTAGVPAITSFTEYIEQFLIPQTLDQLMEPSDVVGNIRFSHPTLYVFPGGQGDAALFGINGFNMLVDGGFARKACFWDFTRHLDRLDAVLVTRFNNCNVGGISSILTKKKEMNVYPQIGHFFCNLVERKHLNSPDGDKDLDPLVVDLIDIGQEMMTNLRCLNLRAHPCYRSADPINLYHKVGHGTLDMYVLSPNKDSREVREFLAKWNASDSKLFANSHRKDSNRITFPVQNLVSICALLVWQPANPEDTITRILFPGSTPQHKVFEGFDHLKNLEFLKHPICSTKSLSPSASVTTLKEKSTKKFEMKKKENIKDQIDSKYSKSSEEPIAKPVPQSSSSAKSVKVEQKTKVENKKIIESELKKIGKDKEMKKGIKKMDETKKTEVIKEETEKTVKTKPVESKKKEIKETKIILKSSKTESKSKRAPPAPEKKKSDKKEIKSSPTTPKKTSNVGSMKQELTQGATKPAVHKTTKILTAPAKSTKDANNRKVLEQKKIEMSTLINKNTSTATTKSAMKSKPIEKKPIVRKTKQSSPSKVRISESPAKSTRSTPTTSVKSDKDGVIRRVKSEKGTAESSTVSTPSGVEAELAAKHITEKSEDISLDSIESKVLADLKEEREAAEEIEAVLQKAERNEVMRKEFEGDDEVTAEATDKKEEDMTEEDVTADIEDVPKKELSRKESQELTEEDEYLIVEAEDSIQSEDTEQKNRLDEVESEKVKIDDEEEKKDEIPEKKSSITELTISDQKEIMDSDTIKDVSKEKKQELLKQDPIIEGNKEFTNKNEETQEILSSSPEKLDVEKKSIDIDAKVDKESLLEKQEESQERISTIESGGTTTAPTLPTDERIPLDEIKEDIDEKHVIEDIKEKDVPVKPEKTEIVAHSTTKPDVKVINVPINTQSVHRDIVKTPDEVADLPVHEEVDPKFYRIDDFDKEKEDKTKEDKEIDKEESTGKEQKGVFGFFEKVADKFEKSIDKLTHKKRKESDADKMTTSKPSSPEDVKYEGKDFAEQTMDMEKDFPKVTKTDHKDLKAELKVTASTDTVISSETDIIDTNKTCVPQPDTTVDAEFIKQEIDNENKMKNLSENVIQEEVNQGMSTEDEIKVKTEDEVEMLLEEASKKFKMVKDSLHDSLESLDEKVPILGDSTLPKDVVKDTLEEVAEKLEGMEKAPPDAKEPEKVKFIIPDKQDIVEDIDEDFSSPLRNLKEAVRDVGEVLAGTAGIAIEDKEKPKNVEEIVKQVAEVLREDDFLLDRQLLSSELNAKTLEDHKGEHLIDEERLIPKKVGITEELPPEEEIEEMLETVHPLTVTEKSKVVEEFHEESNIKQEKDFTVGSSVESIRKDNLLAMSSELLETNIDKTSPSDDNATDIDVLVSGKEPTCEKILLHQKVERVEVPVIGFEQKLTPGKVELVVVTPGSTPSTPKFTEDIGQLEIDIKSVFDKSIDLEQMLKIIILDKKQKITSEMIDHVIIVKGISRETMIYTIVKIIIEHNLLCQDIVDDINILRTEDIDINKRLAMEEFINTEYIKKNKKINSHEIEEISMLQQIPRRVCFEIIEEVIVKQNIPRSDILNMSDSDYLDKYLENIEIKQLFPISSPEQDEKLSGKEDTLVDGESQEKIKESLQNQLQDVHTKKEDDSEAVERKYSVQEKVSRKLSEVSEKDIEETLEESTGKKKITEVEEVEISRQPDISKELDLQESKGSDDTVRRMVVTASSEDGGHEMEICAAGTIIFTKTVSPDDSLKEGEKSIQSTPEKDSLHMDKTSLTSTPEKDTSFSGPIKEDKKESLDDSLEKSMAESKHSGSEDEIVVETTATLLMQKDSELLKKDKDTPITDIKSESKISEERKQEDRPQSPIKTYDSEIEFKTLGSVIEKDTISAKSRSQSIVSEKSDKESDEKAGTDSPIMIEKTSRKSSIAENVTDDRSSYQKTRFGDIDDQTDLTHSSGVTQEPDSNKKSDSIGSTTDHDSKKEAHDFSTTISTQDEQDVITVSTEKIDTQEKPLQTKSRSASVASIKEDTIDTSIVSTKKEEIIKSIEISEPTGVTTSAKVVSDYRDESGIDEKPVEEKSISSSVICTGKEEITTIIDESATDKDVIPELSKSTASVTTSGEGIADSKDKSRIDEKKMQEESTYDSVTEMVKEEIARSTDTIKTDEKMISEKSRSSSIVTTVDQKIDDIADKDTYDEKTIPDVSISDTAIDLTKKEIDTRDRSGSTGVLPMSTEDISKVGDKGKISEETMQTESTFTVTSTTKEEITTSLDERKLDEEIIQKTSRSTSVVSAIEEKMADEKVDEKTIQDKSKSTSILTPSDKSVADYKDQGKIEEKTLQQEQMSSTVTSTANDDIAQSIEAIKTDDEMMQEKSKSISMAATDDEEIGDIIDEGKTRKKSMHDESSDSVIGTVKEDIIKSVDVSQTDDKMMQDISRSSTVVTTGDEVIADKNEGIIGRKLIPEESSRATVISTAKEEIAESLDVSKNDEVTIQEKSTGVTTTAKQDIDDIKSDEAIGMDKDDLVKSTDGSKIDEKLMHEKSESSIGLPTSDEVIPPYEDKDQIEEATLQKVSITTTGISTAKEEIAKSEDQIKTDEKMMQEKSKSTDIVTVGEKQSADDKDKYESVEKSKQEIQKSTCTSTAGDEVTAEKTDTVVSDKITMQEKSPSEIIEKTIQEELITATGLSTTKEEIADKIDESKSVEKRSVMSMDDEKIAKSEKESVTVSMPSSVISTAKEEITTSLDESKTDEKIMQKESEPSQVETRSDEDIADPKDKGEMDEKTVQEKTLIATVKSTAEKEIAESVEKSKTERSRSSSVVSTSEDKITTSESKTDDKTMQEKSISSSVISTAKEGIKESLDESKTDEKMMQEKTFAATVKSTAEKEIAESIEKSKTERSRSSSVVSTSEDKITTSESKPDDKTMQEKSIPSTVVGTTKEEIKKSLDESEKIMQKESETSQVETRSGEDIADSKDKGKIDEKTVQEETSIATVISTKEEGIAKTMDPSKTDEKSETTGVVTPSEKSIVDTDESKITEKTMHERLSSAAVIKTAKEEETESLDESKTEDKTMQGRSRSTSIVSICEEKIVKDTNEIASHEETVQDKSKSPIVTSPAKEKISEISGTKKTDETSTQEILGSTDVVTMSEKEIADKKDKGKIDEKTLQEKQESSSTTSTAKEDAILDESKINEKLMQEELIHDKPKSADVVERKDETKGVSQISAPSTTHEVLSQTEVKPKEISKVESETLDVLDHQSSGLEQMLDDKIHKTVRERRDSSKHQQCDTLMTDSSTKFDTSRKSSIASEKEFLKSRSSSIIEDKTETDTKQSIKEIEDKIKSRSESIVSVERNIDYELEFDDKIHKTVADKLRSTSIISDVESIDRTKSPSSDSDKFDVKGSKSPSIIDEKIDHDDMVHEAEEPKEKIDIIDSSQIEIEKKPSLIDYEKDLTSKLQNLSEHQKSDSDNEYMAKHISDSTTKEETSSHQEKECVSTDSTEKESTQSNFATEIKTPKDRSRSHSVFDTAEKTSLGRSRTASLYDDKLGLSEIAQKDEEDLSKIPLATKIELEKYIIDEFITKNVKINPKSLEEISKLKSVSKYIVISIIEGVIIDRKIRRGAIFETEVESETHHSDSSTVSSTHDLKASSLGDTDSKEFKKSPSPDLDKSEPLIDEEVTLSEEKRNQIENYIMDNYVSKRKKITESEMHSISIETALPKYILSEIIEEIILKKKARKESIAEKSIFQDTDIEDSLEKSPVHHYPDDGRSFEREQLSPEQKYSGHSTPDKKSEKLSYPVDYETQFHKAFVGGMTEIRTTHITTLSGKSTPDLGQKVGTPDSELISAATEESEETDKKFFSKTDEQIGTVQTTVILKTTQITGQSDGESDGTMLKTTVRTEELKNVGAESLEELTQASKTDAAVITTTITGTSLKGNLDVISKPDKIVGGSSDETVFELTATNEGVDAKELIEKLSAGMSGKSTPDIIGKDVLETGSLEQLEHSVSPVIRDLISEDRSYSGKSSPDISLPKDIIYSESTGKSTPDVSVSPLIRDGAMMQSYISGRSTPDKKSEGRSKTATPESFRSGEVMRTIITTTRTMSEDGDIITTTKKVTETTNEKGETVILAEKTDVKVDDRVDEFSLDERQSGAEPAVPSVSIMPQEKHSERDPLHDETTSIADFSAAEMSSSFYGELPTQPLDVKIETSAGSSQEDYSFRQFTKKKVDQTDLDFDKVAAKQESLAEEKQIESNQGTSSDPMMTSFIAADKTEDLKKKDPLEGWDSPLGLPFPKPPREFNLRCPQSSQSSSADPTPDSQTFDVINDWGEPLRLPSPTAATSEISNNASSGTPQKEKKASRKVIMENIKNKKLSESPSKNDKKSKDSKNKLQPVYMDLTYVPHHGNSFYTALEFFKKIRARYYVFSGTEPSREVYDALLEAKKTWEDKDLEVTIIPTYDTDTLGYWVADNEEALTANHIDLSPSASRCTINLQDHETSCSAYRLEF